MRVERWHEFLRDGVGERDQVHALGRQVERAGVEPREIEQVGGQLLQPLHLLGDRLEELRARLVVELLVLQQLDEPAQREDRRAELVRRVGDELTPRAVDPFQLALHLVECARQLPELVLGVHRERRDEPARRDLLRRALESLHPAREPPGDQIAAEQSDEQRARARDEHAPPDQADGLGDVVEAAGVDRDPRAQAGQRARDLSGVDAGEVGDDSDRLARLERLVAASSGSSGRRCAWESEIDKEDVVALLHAEQRDLRPGGVGDRADELVELGGRDRLLLRALQLAGGGTARAFEVVELLVLEALPELRHDEEEDEAEREGDDPEEQERELVAERPESRAVHPSRKW